MRILILGAGATGGYFGARLTEAGRDTTFLVRPARKAQLGATGLQIESPYGNTALSPKLLLAEELPSHPPFDLILFTTKSYSLAPAMSDVAPAVGPGTLILPILNGLQHLAALQEYFGPEKVLGGTCRIIADLTPEGRVLHLTPLNELHFGTLHPSQNVAAISEALTVAGIKALPEPDILAAMWEKWWILASLGSVCILARGTVGQCAATPYGPALARAVVAECTSIAAGNGYPASQSMVRAHLTRLEDPTSTLTSSLYRDMTRNQPVEADHILGDLLARAGSLPAPLLTAAYTQLKVYESTR